jgi:hypothetical protein
MTDRYDPIGLTQFEIRKAMVENGYNPTPLTGKKPLLDGWQRNLADLATIERWGNTGSGTGMVTARTPVIDIDVEDQQAAELIEQTIRECVADAGEILVRVGQFPRRAIPFRTDDPFRKRKLKLTAPDGTTRSSFLATDSNWLLPAFTPIPISPLRGGPADRRSIRRGPHCRR